MSVLTAKLPVFTAQLTVPYYLAPMAEISHRALRELIEDFGGCDCYFSEMISAKAVFSGGPFERWYMDTAPKPEKLVFQIVGSEADAVSRAAACLDSLDCAGIDINMGCSAPLIIKKGGGAAWMASIDNASRLISQVRPLVKSRLSVKLRIGFKDDFDYLTRFCRSLQDEGVELITLHPRLVNQKFKRLARWEYVGALRQELKIPVAGNGDVSAAVDLVRRAGDPCDAVMTGRAAVKMPWIFAEARKLEELTANDTQAKRDEEFSVNRMSRREHGDDERPYTDSLPRYEDIGLRFLELLALYQPAEFHISRARRFFTFFCQNLKWGTNLINQLNREETLSGFSKVWKKHFAERAEDDITPGSHQENQ